MSSFLKLRILSIYAISWLDSFSGSARLALSVLSSQPASTAAEAKFELRDAKGGRLSGQSEGRERERERTAQGDK